MVRGVRKFKGGKYRAYIKLHIGLYDTKVEAMLARLRKEEELFGDLMSEKQRQLLRAAECYNDFHVRVTGKGILD